MQTKLIRKELMRKLRQLEDERSNTKDRKRKKAITRELRKLGEELINCTNNRRKPLIEKIIAKGSSMTSEEMYHLYSSGAKTRSEIAEFAGVSMRDLAKTLEEYQKKECY